MHGATPLLPHCVFMAWCVVKHRDNFTFYLYLYLLYQNPCKLHEKIQKIKYMCYNGMLWYHLSHREQWPHKVGWSQFQETNKHFYMSKFMLKFQPGFPLCFKSFCFYCHSRSLTCQQFICILLRHCFQETQMPVYEPVATNKSAAFMYHD
jgi:hypothetical protein